MSTLALRKKKQDSYAARSAKRLRKRECKAQSLANVSYLLNARNRHYLESYSNVFAGVTGPKESPETVENGAPVQPQPLEQTKTVAAPRRPVKRKAPASAREDSQRIVEDSSVVLRPDSTTTPAHKPGGVAPVPKTRQITRSVRAATPPAVNISPVSRYSASTLSTQSPESRTAPDPTARPQSQPVTTDDHSTTKPQHAHTRLRKYFEPENCSFTAVMRVSIFLVIAGAFLLSSHGSSKPAPLSIKALSPKRDVAADPLSDSTDALSDVAADAGVASTLPLIQPEITLISSNLSETSELIEAYQSTLAELQLENEHLENTLSISKLETDALQAETLELHRELLQMELALTAANNAANESVQVKTVYNFVNVPIDNSSSTTSDGEAYYPIGPNEYQAGNQEQFNEQFLEDEYSLKEEYLAEQRYSEEQPSLDELYLREQGYVETDIENFYSDGEGGRVYFDGAFADERQYDQGYTDDQLNQADQLMLYGQQERFLENQSIPGQ